MTVVFGDGVDSSHPDYSRLIYNILQWLGLIYVYIYLYLIMFACRMPGIRYIGIIALQIKQVFSYQLTFAEHLQGLVPRVGACCQKNPKDVKP